MVGLQIAWLLLITGVWAAILNVGLEAKWNEAPFSLQLLESAGACDESLYIEVAKALFLGQEVDVSDFEEEEENEELEDGLEQTEILTRTDRSAYGLIKSSLSSTQLGLLNLHLVNKLATPRIQAHYTFFNQSFGAELQKIEQKCGSDSFGEPLADPLKAWVKYGDKIYCSESDLFALQTDSKSEELMDFDRVIGSDVSKPVLALYGDPDSPRFGGMFNTLLLFADSDKIRFVWRYVPSLFLKTNIPGYGVTITAKTKLDLVPPAIGDIKDITAYLQNIRQHEQLFSIDDSKIPELSVKIASIVLEQPDSLSKFGLLREILQNLPVYGPHLVGANIANERNVQEIALLNEKKGASSESVGLYINGAAIHRLEVDLPFVTNKLMRELTIMEELDSYGLSKSQSKLLLSKFALLSAFKESEFKAGSSSNRYPFYLHEFVPFDENSGGVVLFNNIESDETYQMMSTDRKEIYTGSTASTLHMGQIPPLKENVHDLIFVMNFSNKHQLKVFFTMAKIILDRGIAQQVGVLPLVENEKDAEIADLFYHIMEVGESKEAMALLYKYYESKPEDEEALLSLVKIPAEKRGLYQQYNHTLSDFSLKQASVIINGVIHNMRSTNWRSALGLQIAHDVRVLQQSIIQGTDKGKPLKSILYTDAKSRRNTNVVPLDPANIRYKKISPELIDNSCSFVKNTRSDDISLTFWLIGDFGTSVIRKQFVNLMKFMDSYDEKSIQVRVFDTASNRNLIEKIHKQVGSKSLQTSDILKIISMVRNAKVQESVKDEQQVAILERNEFQLHFPMMLLNSRYLRLTKEFTLVDLEDLVDYELSQRLGIFKEITDAYPDLFSWKPIMHFKKGKFNHLDWFDLLSSTISNSFFMEDSMLLSDVSRFDFASLSFENSIDLTGYSSDKPIDMLVIVDPVDEYSQKLVSLASAFTDLPFVNVLVLLQPLSETETPNDLTRFYTDAFVRSEPEFNEDGSVVQNSSCVFASNLGDTELIVDIDLPKNWYAIKGKNSDIVDLTNLKLKENLNTTFDLSKLVVEGYAKDVATARTIPGLVLQASNDEVVREGFTMKNLGYSQLLLEPGTWELGIKMSGSEDISLELLSASGNKYAANDIPQKSVTLPVYSLKQMKIYPRIRKSEAASNAVQVPTKHADVNIFSIASGHMYEQLMSIMMLSVTKHTESLVKFWLVENFLSQGFISKVPQLAAQFGFEYEFVRYKWPVWLREQKKLHRTVWAFKILFLDALFPSDLDKVIFVDADQIARADLQELVDLDLQGAPYGFAPMCESRKEMEGFQFWKSGYWPTVLKEDLKYHISALYVVDLQVFRQNQVGDKLRTHYQKLSTDPNSLSNLDQDLPNNLQRVVPIHTLPQEWLWCETWCADSEKAHAKMIDMCNNPKSHEGKIEQARRIVPEWDEYNLQVNGVGHQSAIVHDEL